MTPDQQLRSALRSGNAEQIADLTELMEAESLPPRRKIAAAAVNVLEASAQRREALLSAETQDMIETTRRIWNTTDPIEY